MTYAVILVLLALVISLCVVIAEIQKLVLAGRMGEAIEFTRSLYPGLLESNANLLFMLKCRQFIEMVGGCDASLQTETIRTAAGRSAAGKTIRNPLRATSSSPHNSPRHPTNKAPRLCTGDHILSSASPRSHSAAESDSDRFLDGSCDASATLSFEQRMNRQNSSMNGESASKPPIDNDSTDNSDDAMHVDGIEHVSNGNSKEIYTNGCTTGKNGNDCEKLHKEAITYDNSENGMEDCDADKMDCENGMGK